MVGMKKGQITLFIIIGLVLLLTASFFILKSQEFSDEKSETERRETQDLSLSTTNFQDYVEGCMQLVVPKAVKSVAVKGGFNEWHAPYLYFSEEYNFICDVVLGDGCVNSIRSRSAISEELEYNISRSLERCLDISVFEEQGYEVTSQPVIDPVQVQIGIVDLSVIFNYNVRLERNNDIEQFTRFTQTYDYPLLDIGDLIELGAISDALKYKRQYSKAQTYELMFQQGSAEFVFDQENQNRVIQFSPNTFDKDDLY